MLKINKITIIWKNMRSFCATLYKKLLHVSKYFWETWLVTKVSACNENQGIVAFTGAYFPHIKSTPHTFYSLSLLSLLSLRLFLISQVVSLCKMFCSRPLIYLPRAKYSPKELVVKNTLRYWTPWVLIVLQQTFGFF
jgi:hypothetical protein